MGDDDEGQFVIELSNGATFSAPTASGAVRLLYRYEQSDISADDARSVTDVIDEAFDSDE